MLMIAPRHVAQAQTPPGSETLKIRVEVTDAGFNPAELEIEQGRLVELTFVWAHIVHTSEEHIIVLEGYKLEWDKINSAQKEATVRFIADKPGTFTFKCDLDCDVHDLLQNGALKVKRGASTSGGGQAAFTPTALTLTASTLLTRGESVALMAVLKDTGGAPVSKAQIQFQTEGEFGGVKGPMSLGVAKTDANGVAFLSYRPTLEVDQQVITARFDGLGVYSESKEALAVKQLGIPPSAYFMEPVGLGSIRNEASVALIVAVLAVWATLAFVLFQAVSIIWTRRQTK